MGDWYYTETGDPRHKVPWNKLVDLYQSGEITDKTFVWQKKQVKDWTQLSKLPHVLQKLETGVKETLEPGSRSGRGGHRSKKSKSKTSKKSKHKKQRASRSQNSSHTNNDNSDNDDDMNDSNNNNNNNSSNHNNNHNNNNHNYGHNNNQGHNNRMHELDNNYSNQSNGSSVNGFDHRYDSHDSRYNGGATHYQSQQQQQQQHPSQNHQHHHQHQGHGSHKKSPSMLSQSITDVLSDSNESDLSDGTGQRRKRKEQRNKRSQQDTQQHQQQQHYGNNNNNDDNNNDYRKGYHANNNNNNNNNNYYGNGSGNSSSGKSRSPSDNRNNNSNNNNGRKMTPMDTPSRHTPRAQQLAQAQGHSPLSPNGHSHRLVVDAPYSFDIPNHGAQPGYNSGTNMEDGAYNDKYRINLMDGNNNNNNNNSRYRSHRERNGYNNQGQQMGNGSAPPPQQGSNNNNNNNGSNNQRRGHSHSPNIAMKDVQIGQIVRLQRGSIVMDATITDITKHEMQIMYEDNQGEWIDKHDPRIISIEARMSDNPDYYRQPSVSGKMMKDIGKQSRKKPMDYKQSFEENDYKDGNSPTITRNGNTFTQRTLKKDINVTSSSSKNNNNNENSDETVHSPPETHGRTNTHTRTRGGFMASGTHRHGGERRLSATMLHDIAKAASDAIQLRDQQRMLEVERERFEREKREFSIYKDQVKQEYEMRKYEYDEQIRTYVAKKQLYGEALKRMEQVDEEYSKSVRMHLDFQKLEEKRRSIKRRFKDIRSMHEKAYNLLEIIRNETIRLNALRKKYASKCKEMHSLINDKNEQHKQFVEEMYKLKKEMLYLPWLVMGGKEAETPGGTTSGGVGAHGVHHSSMMMNKPIDLDVDDIRAELLKGWEELERERNKWDVVRRKVEKKSVLITSYQSEEKMLVNVRKKLDNARLFEKEWKQKMLQDINKMIESQTGEAIDEKLLNIHKQEIELECAKQSLKDDLRHLQQDQELLALQQKHLNEQVLEVEKTREVVDAKQARLNTLKIMGKPGMYSFSSNNDAEMKRIIRQKDGKIEALNEELINKKQEISERALELERQKGQCLKLQMQLAEEQKRKTELSKEEERKALSGFVIQFQEEIQKYHKENVSLQIQVKEYKDKFENNEKLVKEIESEKSDILEKVNKLEDEKIDLTEKNKELNEYCAYLEDHTKEVEQQFNDILHANIMALDEQNKIRKKHINNQKSLDFAAVKMKNLSVDFSGVSMSGGNTPKHGSQNSSDPPTFHRQGSDTNNIHNRHMTGPPPFASTKLSNLDSNGSDDKKDDNNNSNNNGKEGVPNDSEGNSTNSVNKKGDKNDKNNNKNNNHQKVKPSDEEQHRTTGTVLYHGDVSITPQESPIDTPVHGSPGGSARNSGIGGIRMVDRMEAPKLLQAESGQSLQSNDSSSIDPPSPQIGGRRSSKNDKSGNIKNKVNNNNNNNKENVANKSNKHLKKFGSNLSLADLNSNSINGQEDGDTFLNRMASQLASQDISSKHNLLSTSMENLTDFARKVSMDFNLQPNKNFDFLDDLQLSDEDDSDDSDIDAKINGGKGRTKREESLNMDAIANHLKKLEQTIDQNHRNVSAKLKKLQKSDDPNGNISSTNKSSSNNGNSGNNGSGSGKRSKSKGKGKGDNNNNGKNNNSSNNNNNNNSKNGDNNDGKKKNKRGETEDLAYAMVENGWVGPHDLIASPQDDLHGSRQRNKEDFDDDQIDSDYLDSDEDLDDKDDGYHD